MRGWVSESHMSMSLPLIRVSSSCIGIPTRDCIWPLAIVFWMIVAIFFVAWVNTSFMLSVMGCASPRYLAADWAALAYEFKDAWYYLRNSCSTAMLWYAMHSTIRRSSGFLDCCCENPASVVFKSYSCCSCWVVSAPSVGNLEMSSSWIRMRAFIECYRASSCFPIWLKMAQMFKWMSQGFEIWRQSSTARTEKWR